MCVCTSASYKLLQWTVPCYCVLWHHMNCSCLSKKRIEWIPVFTLHTFVITIHDPTCTLCRLARAQANSAQRTGHAKCEMRNAHNDMSFFICEKIHVFFGAVAVYFRMPGCAKKYALLPVRIELFSQQTEKYACTLNFHSNINKSNCFHTDSLRNARACMHVYCTWWDMDSNGSECERMSFQLTSPLKNGFFQSAIDWNMFDCSADLIYVRLYSVSICSVQWNFLTVRPAKRIKWA